MRRYNEISTQAFFHAPTSLLSLVVTSGGKKFLSQINGRRVPVLIYLTYNIQIVFSVQKLSHTGYTYADDVSLIFRQKLILLVLKQ